MKDVKSSLISVNDPSPLSSHCKWSPIFIPDSFNISSVNWMYRSPVTGSSCTSTTQLFGLLNGYSGFGKELDPVIASVRVTIEHTINARLIYKFGTVQARGMSNKNSSAITRLITFSQFSNCICFSMKYLWSCF